MTIDRTGPILCFVHSVSDLDAGLALIEEGADGWGSLDIVQVRGKELAADDMERLSAYADAIDADRVLTINAGRDAVEAREIASAFRAVGPKRLVFTGMDMSRRLGSLLAVADGCQAAFSEMSHTAEIVDGIHRINPVKLARLLLEYVHAPATKSKRRPNLGDADRQATSWK